MSYILICFQAGGFTRFYDVVVLPYLLYLYGNRNGNERLIKVWLTVKRNGKDTSSQHQQEINVAFTDKVICPFEVSCTKTEVANLLQEGMNAEGYAGDKAVKLYKLFNQ